MEKLPRNPSTTKEKKYTQQELWNKYKEFRASLIVVFHSGDGGVGSGGGYSFVYKDNGADFLLWLEIHP